MPESKTRSLPTKNSASLAVCLLALLPLAYAKDPPHISKSKETYEKVQSASAVSKEGVRACIDAQEADLKKPKKSERGELHFRNGYCSLIGALLSGNHADFERAQKEFVAASGTAKGDPALTIETLFAIARLSDGRIAKDADKDLADSVAETNCAKSGYVGKSACESALSAGRLWLGWEALRADKPGESRKYFERVPASPWNAWLTGIAASEEKKWPEAAAAFEKAANAWSDAEKSGKSANDLLYPKPDRGGLYARLGSAQFMAGKYAESIPSLTATIQDNPGDPYPLFLRARAQENLGHRAEALSDYTMAANAGSNPKRSQGEAHFYRGMLLLRRGALSAASEELAYADNLPVSRIPQADIAAWHALAQARTGDCKTPLDRMEAASAAASAVFPRSELESLEFDCRVRKAATLQDLVALDPAMHKRYGGPNSAETRKRISDAYLKHALAAEERTEPELAATAYRKAIEWNPRATKARFNLAGIYIEEKKYDAAETEYRALLKADPADHEAQYWLAESILSQEPDAERKAEACVVLKEALKTGDAEKKTLSTALSIMANCQR